MTLVCSSATGSRPRWSKSRTPAPRRSGTTLDLDPVELPGPQQLLGDAVRRCESPLDAIRLGPCAHPREQALSASAERKGGPVVAPGDEPVERHAEINDDSAHLDSFAPQLPLLRCQLLTAPELI